MGLRPCVPGVPRRPFILRLWGFAPPGRVAGSGAWAGLEGGVGRQRREPLASRPDFGDSAWKLVLSALRAEGQRGAGAVVVVAAVHERWLWRRRASAVPSPGLCRRHWPRPSQLLSGRRGVAPPDPGSDPACVQPLSGRTQCGALPLSLQPVEAKLPGIPKASLCAPRGPPGLRSPRSPRCRVARGRFDEAERPQRPRENNAQKSVVWPRPLLFPRAPQTVPRGPFPPRENSLCHQLLGPRS